MTAQAAVDMTPMIKTPSGINSEKKTERTDNDPEKELIDTSLSLDQFQARYTSEDNASFIEIVERINAQKREKYRWLYEQGKKSQLLIENGQSSGQKLLLEAGQIVDQDTGVAVGAVTSEESSKLALIFKDKRSGSIPTWEYNVSWGTSAIGGTILHYPSKHIDTILFCRWIRAIVQEHIDVLPRRLGYRT